MKTHVFTALAAAAIAGCGTETTPASAETDSGAGSEGTGEASSQGGATGNDTSPTGGSTGGPSTSTGTAGSSGEDTDDGGTCGTNCNDGEPEVLWVAEPQADLLGGRCLDVVGDGQGGAVASFSTDEASNFTAGGLVMAVSAGGDEVDMATLEQHQVEGMQRVGPGTFAWVNSWAHTATTTTDLDDLEGQTLGAELWTVDDLALTDSGAAYSIMTGSILPECRVRLGAVETPPVICGQDIERWRLEPEGSGVAGGLIGQSALVRVDGSGSIVAYLEWRYNRTLLDLAVTDDGDVWTVGVIGDPDEVGPTFGSFVARHGPDLEEEPIWEGLEEGDTSFAWTAVVLRDGAPILVGHDEDDSPRIAALTPSGDLSWTLRPELPPSVYLRQADIDDDGQLVICGEQAFSTPVVLAVAIP